MQATSSYGKLIAKLAVPVASLIAVLLVIMLACLIFVARYQSEVAWREQAKLASGAIGVKSEHIRRRAIDYGAWDDALENLVTHLDTAWADENVGKTLFFNLHTEMTFVVAPDNSATYASINGVHTQDQLDDLLSGGIHELIERQRGGPRNDAVSGLILANGRPAIAAVMPIRPLEPDPRATYPQHMIVLVDFLDEPMLAEFADIYLLPELKILSSGSEPQRSVPIVLSDGRIFGALTWQGADHGADLLWFMVPVWIVVTTCIVGLTAVSIQKAMRVAHRFDDNEYRARHDALTGLPNRFLLFQVIERLAEQPSNACGFAVAYMDLDGFKPINDRFGHAAGDVVLRTIAERLRASLPAPSFVARNGGDEFVAVFRDVSSQRGVHRLCEAIVACVREPICIDGRFINVGVTVGVAFSPLDGQDALTLLRKADEALYEGKMSGKGTIRFHNGLQPLALNDYHAAAVA